MDSADGPDRFPGKVPTPHPEPLHLDPGPQPRTSDRVGARATPRPGPLGGARGSTAEIQLRPQVTNDRLGRLLPVQPQDHEATSPRFILLITGHAVTP